MIYATGDSAGRSSDTVAEFVDTTKRYGAVVAASQLNLQIRRGEFLSFLGPSGCGKTTALRMLAGFEAPSEGEIMIDGARVGTTPAYKRPVNMVFQSYALFPHMTVAQNVAYGLRQRRPRVAKADIALRVRRALETVRLGGFEGRRIWEMSGGQQQRVALARAIVNEPKILLLDEPMAALDARLRTDMQLELLSLQRELGITFVLVTHDQQEALSMSDRICIMGGGRIAQIGTPRQLYDHPINRYVAGFVGRANILPAKVIGADHSHARVVLGSGDEVVVETPVAVAGGDTVDVMIRPESLRFAAGSAAPATTVIEVTVTNRIFLGEHIEFLLTHPVLGALQVLVSRQAERGLPDAGVGATTHLAWDHGAGLVIGHNN